MRHSERGSFDRETVNAILDAALLCHVGYVLDGAPLVTPISVSVAWIACNAPRISASPRWPMQPMRKLGATVSLPG